MSITGMARDITATGIMAKRIMEKGILSMGNMEKRVMGSMERQATANMEKRAMKSKSITDGEGGGRLCR